MKLYYLDQCEDLADLPRNEREERLNQLFSELFQANQIVQEVSIDGTSFREGYESELLEHMMDIQEVRFITVQGEILLQDIFEELKVYIPKVITATGSISDLFYGDMNAEGWGYFSQLIEGIGWIEKSVNIMIEQYNRSPGVEPLQQPLAVFLDNLPRIVQELEECLGREEYVAIGDLIKYELGKVLQNLESEIQSKVIV